MPPEFTNLLPRERQQSLARDYLFRLATLALIALGLLLISHGALLAPTYAYMLEEKAVQEGRVTELSERRQVSGFTDLSERINAFALRAESLEELRAHPSASDSVRAILSLPQTGISLTGFAFASPEGGNPGRMQVSGTAKTRESLRAFDSALSSLSFVRATDLPLSAYARESDIPFSIALTLDFTTP